MLSHVNGFIRKPSVIKPNPSQQPQFGWSLKEPPKQYTVSLNNNDFDDNFHPTPAFISKLSPFLMRGDHLQKPGFLMVSNLEKSIPKNQINRFLEKSLLAMKAHLSESYQTLFNPNKVALTAIKKRQIDGEIPAEGNLHTAETKGKWTLKSPHFDRNAHLVLHRYEPTENVRDGHLQVIDIKQFLKDHPQETLADMLNADKTIRKEKWAALEPYKLTLHTNSGDHKVVFLHNTPQNGIAHGVTPLRPIDESKPMKRVFERYTITPFEPHKTLPPDVSRIED